MKSSLSLFTPIILLSTSAYGQIKGLRQSTKRGTFGIMFMVLALAVVLSAACSKGSSTTPTGALKGYYEAAKKKDYAAAKKYLSANTITLMEVGSKKMGKSPEEAFKESSTDANTSVMPEFGNEKITGDTATVDMKAEGQMVTMPMVKENGEWKLAMDKLFGNMSNQMNETPKPPAGADIVFSEDGNTPSIITFNESEMRQLEASIEGGKSTTALDYVSRKMELMGLKCCEPRKRIDVCVWQCCDKSTISTCNKTLQTVLEKSDTQ